MLFNSFDCKYTCCIVRGSALLVESIENENRNILQVAVGPSHASAVQIFKPDRAHSSWLRHELQRVLTESAKLSTFTAALQGTEAMTSIHPLSTSQDGFFCQLSGPTLQHCFEVGEAAASSAPLAAPIARLRELHTRMQHLPYVLPSFLSRNAAFSQVPGRPLFPTAAIDQGAQSNRTHDQQPHLHGLPHGSISAPKSLREAVLPRSSVSQDRSTFAVGIGSLLQPQGDTSCDDTFTAKVINVVTSLPFSAVGLHMLRYEVVVQLGFSSAAGLNQNLRVEP